MIIKQTTSFKTSSLRSLFKINSYMVFRTDVRVKSGATILTAPNSYALTDEMSITLQQNAANKNFFLSYRLNSFFNILNVVLVVSVKIIADMPVVIIVYIAMLNLLERLVLISIATANKKLEIIK